MQPSNIYRERPVHHSITPLKPKFKIFFACENQAADFQARKLRDQLDRLCRDHFDISCVDWNFALLRHATLRRNAVHEAAEADMIVIALHGGNELPTYVRDWIECWPVRSQRGQAALVALVAPEYENWVDRHFHVAYLQNAAEQRGLDFIGNFDNWRQTDLPRYWLAKAPDLAPMPPLPETWAASAALTNDNYRLPALSLPCPWPTGGINE